jgi:hypothetical protein
MRSDTELSSALLVSQHGQMAVLFLLSFPLFRLPIQLPPSSHTCQHPVMLAASTFPTSQFFHLELQGELGLLLLLEAPVMQDVRGVATGEGGGGSTHCSQGTTYNRRESADLHHTCEGQCYIKPTDEHAPVHSCGQGTSCRSTQGMMGNNTLVDEQRL